MQYVTGDVADVLLGCYKGAIGKLQACDISVKGLLHECYRDATGVIQRCNEVLQIFVRFYKVVTMVLHMSFMGVTSVLQVDTGY